MKYNNFLKDQFHEITRDIATFGSLLFTIAAIIFLYFINSRASLILLTTFIIIEIMGSLIKLIFNKIRPNKQRFTNILEKIDAGSFPSIHSTRVILIALSIYPLLSSTIALFFLALVVILVGISRVVLKKHYVTDVIAGYIFGFLVWYLSNRLF